MVCPVHHGMLGIQVYADETSIQTVLTTKYINVSIIYIVVSTVSIDVVVSIDLYTEYIAVYWTDHYRSLRIFWCYTRYVG